jgi:ParB-like chromosome segregation protein Spo0J
MPERPRARVRYAHHPLAEMFPLLNDAEFDDLVEDIRKHGLRDPISLFEQMIIDGRNRERACIKAGVEPRYRPIEFDNHDAAAAYVISKNIRRRHLTPKQKRALIEKVLSADPTKSDRQIARAVKVDNKTVGAVRKRAEAREEIPHVSKRTDSKGRSQVAHKRNSANKRIKSTIDLTDQCIEGVRETVERTIRDLRRARAMTFERLFVALAKVIEDIKRNTLARDKRKSFYEHRRNASNRPPGSATRRSRQAVPIHRRLREGRSSLRPRAEHR